MIDLWGMIGAGHGTDRTTQVDHCWPRPSRQAQAAALGGVEELAGPAAQPFDPAVVAEVGAATGGDVGRASHRGQAEAETGQVDAGHGHRVPCGPGTPPTDACC